MQPGTRILAFFWTAVENDRIAELGLLLSGRCPTLDTRCVLSYRIDMEAMQDVDMAMDTDKLNGTGVSGIDERTDEQTTARSVNVPRLV